MDCRVDRRRQKVPRGGLEVRPFPPHAQGLANFQESNEKGGLEEEHKIGRERRLYERAESGGRPDKLSNELGESDSIDRNNYSCLRN